MNIRVLRIELRRSIALWAGGVLLAFALAFLYLIPGMWWHGSTRWTDQWTSMALWTRSLLVFLWPLALGAGALQGLRDHRSRMPELLTSTPRPARHRAAALAGPTALTLFAAFALLVLVGAVQVLAGDGFAHWSWLPISLVGALALASGAVLGMGIGRVLPSALTPPALTVAAFVCTNLLRQTSDAAIPDSAVPNRISLLSPAVAEARELYLTLSGSVHLGQTLWLLGTAVAGFALLAAATRKGRLLAVTPLLAGAVLALLVLPSAPDRTYVMDKAASARVCDGPVCLTKAHESRLDELAGSGKKALRLLHGALGDQAPTAVRESTAPRRLGDPLEPSRKTVLLDFDDGMIADAKGDRELTRAMVAEGLAPLCWPRSERESGTLEDTVTQGVAAAWVFGDLQPVKGTMHRDDHQRAQAGPVWKKLKARPEAEQRARIRAMHTAALSCEGDPLKALAEGTAR